MPTPERRQSEEAAKFTAPQFGGSAAGEKARKLAKEMAAEDVLTDGRGISVPGSRETAWDRDKHMVVGGSTEKPAERAYKERPSLDPTPPDKEPLPPGTLGDRPRGEIELTPELQRRLEELRKQIDESN